MLRLIPLIFLLACTAQASKLDEKPPAAAPVPRNLVCERVAIKTPKTECIPEYTDVGEHHLHTARVAQGEGYVACGLDDVRLSVLCDGLFFVPPQPEAQAEPSAASSKPDKAAPPAKAAAKAPPKK